MPSLFRRWTILAAAIVLFLISFVLVSFWRAHRAAAYAAAEVAASGRLQFELTSLDRHVPGGVEPIAVSPAFRDVAVFDGRTFIAGANALTAYRGNELSGTWRVGLELPAAELIALSVFRGELYIATHGEGLLRYDGARMRNVLPAKPEMRRVTALLALNDRLVFGTETNGVGVYDGQSLSFLDPALETQHITALAGSGSGASGNELSGNELSGNELWIGTLADGLWHLHAGELEHLKDTLPDPQILSLAVVGETAYAGTPLGVVAFEAGRKTRVLGDGIFARSLLPSGGGLLIGTEDEGVLAVEKDRHRPIETDGALTTEPVERLFASGNTRYALTRSVLYRRSGRGWESVVSPAAGALADRHISALAVDRAGRLWTGYFDRGLDVVASDRTITRHYEDDHLFCVNRIVTNGERTAVATANGLILFGNTDQKQILGRSSGLIADHVTDVVFTDGGMIAATPAGLSFLDAGGVHSVYVFNGLVNNHVYALGASGGRLLAGTLGGLSVLDRDVIRANYTTANSGLKHNWITAVVRDGDDWLAGTYGAGAMRLDKSGIWHTFPDMPRSVINPNAMLVADGRVFAGTLGDGLLVLDRSGRWQRFSSGLPSRNVTALAFADGSLYAGTDNGLVRIESQVLP